MNKKIIEDLKIAIESIEKELSEKPKTSEDYLKEISESLKKMNEKLSKLTKDKKSTGNELTYPNIDPYRHMVVYPSYTKEKPRKLKIWDTVCDDRYHHYISSTFFPTERK